MSEPRDSLSAINHQGVEAVIDHCFRENNCAQHLDHQGDECCCCGHTADAHEGCDCE